MDLAALGKAIYDRAASDTGSGGLFNASTPLITAFYNTWEPDDAVKPYCFYNVLVSNPNDTFTGENEEVMFRISLCVQKEPEGSPPVDPIKRSSDIIARLIGPGGATPAYGFHRYAITITSSDHWSSGSVVRAGQNQNHGNDYYQFDLDFRVHLRR